MARRVGVLVAVAVVLGAADAAAYRPFDGTDADVAEEGEFELELGPVHYLREARQSYLITPATVLNYGVARNVELVCDFQNVVGLERVPGQARDRLVDTDVLVKWVMRRGVLQQAGGPSVAVEAGPLLPELGGEHPVGAQANFIGSYRWSFATVHLNGEGFYSRRHEPGAFGSLIVEGPDEWSVRPVTELAIEDERRAHVTYSGLVGAIWSVRESLAIDAAFRAASLEGHPAREVRLGFTWAWPVGEPVEGAPP